MKNVISIVGIGFLFGMIELQAAIPKHSPEFYETIKPEVREAQRKGANAKIIYRVVDDEGMPITNTVVHSTWQNDYPRKTWKKSMLRIRMGYLWQSKRLGASSVV